MIRPPLVPSAVTTLLGDSPSIRSIHAWIAAVSRSDASALVYGESGTGKELVARALHNDGPRRGGPFVAVNCAAFPDTLIETELFGHVKGAFTGAVDRRAGRFVMANGGTLFLDEIGELSLPAQAKLLRVLQERVVEPVGGDRAIAVDVRIISATHRDLALRVADGRFREDLYYRLNVLNVTLPPLRLRIEDLALLVAHIVARYAGSAPVFTPRAIAALAAYGFPGNVRELENVVQYALVMANGGAIDVAELPEEITRDLGAIVEVDPVVAAALPLAEARRIFEREYLLQVLGQNRGHRGATAKALGISRKGLWEKMREHGLDQAA